MYFNFQKNKIGRLGFVLVLFAMIFTVQKSSAFKLSPQAEISLITCDPGDDAASVYGHSAIRVKDPAYNYDLAFNYGIYDFSSPNFLYRFASGQTDYLLAAYKFDAFVKSYQREERGVYEQVLDLSQAEKQNMLDFLIWNAKDENRVYRYNFFFDNCATRVRDVIAANVDGGITYKSKSSSKTFRRLIKDYHGRLQWLSFGIDFLVSAPSDREATLNEEMFLPDYVMSHFATAVRNENGLPLVKSSRTVYKAPEARGKNSWLTGPLAVTFLLLLFVAWASFRQFRKGKIKPALDYFLFGLNGFSGIFIGWFVLFSEHPAMSPNYNLLWLIPLNFPFIFLWMVKKWRPVLQNYHILLAAWWGLFVCFGAFLPQKFHPAIFVLAAIMFVRSFFYVASILGWQRRKVEK